MNRLLLAFLMLVPFTSFADPNDYIQEKPPVKKSSIGFENLAAEVGIRTSNATVDTTGVSTTAANGFQAGASGQLEFNESWALRTGLFYTQRPFKLSVDASVGSGSADYTFTYIDIPVDIMYKFSDFGGVFFGPGLSMLLEGKVSGSGLLSGLKVEKENSTIIPIQLGVTFKFTPNMGATLFYETVSGEAAKDIKNFRAAGANLLFTFD
jgi:hypothetical protein